MYVYVYMHMHTYMYMYMYMYILYISLHDLHRLTVAEQPTIAGIFFCDRNVGVGRRSASKSEHLGSSPIRTDDPDHRGGHTSNTGGRTSHRPNEKSEEIFPANKTLNASLKVFDRIRRRVRAELTGLLQCVTRRAAKGRALGSGELGRLGLDLKPQRAAGPQPALPLGLRRSKIDPITLSTHHVKRTAAPEMNVFHAGSSPRNRGTTFAMTWRGDPRHPEAEMALLHPSVALGAKGS